MEFKRNNGLFSNVNILQRDIAYQNEVGDIKLYLTEYYKDLNIYPFLFQENKDIKLKSEELEYIRANENCSARGLFDSKIDLNKMNAVKNKYLNLSDGVLKQYENLKKGLPKEYLFVWYRATDKITENTIPAFDEFCNFVKGRNLKNLPIVLKTDSKNFYTYFTTQFIDYYYLEAIPISNNADYLNLKDKNDLEFRNKYGIYKYEYLQRILAITKIASESNIYIATNSNINSFVIQQRNNFNNVFVFANATHLIDYIS